MPKATRCGGILGFVNKRGRQKANRRTGGQADRLTGGQADRLKGGQAFEGLRRFWVSRFAVSGFNFVEGFAVEWLRRLCACGVSGF